MIFLLSLFILLLIISIVIYIKYNKDIFEPSFLFSISFSALAFMGILNYKKWNLDLHINTFLVVILGVLEFCLICFLVKKCFQKKYKKNLTEKDKKEGK